MILIINLNENELYYYEFIKPIINIIEKFNLDFEVKTTTDTPQSLEKYSKIIIAGTSLKEFNYLEHIEKFKFLKTTNKPVLGICAGAQIIGSIHGSEIKEGLEIGMSEIEILKLDKIIENVDFKEIYNLHKKYSEIPKGFELIAKTKYPQIMKKENKYMILFHPEARQKKLIENFLQI